MPLTPTPSRSFRSRALRPIVLVPVVLASGGAMAASVASRQTPHRNRSGAAATRSSELKGSAAAPASSSATGGSVSAPSSSSATPGAVILSGPADGALLGKTKARIVEFQLSGVGPERVHATMDGQPVVFTASNGSATLRPATLSDGVHTLDLSVDGAATGDTHVRREFTVDTAAPSLAVSPPGMADKGKPLTISGTTDDGATVTANGEAVPVAAGAWQAKFVTAPVAVRVVASDAAGNSNTKDVAVHFPMPVTRAVHPTARAWGYKPKREAAMALLKERKINAIEVDIKDESGLVGYDTKVPLAATIGAIEPHYTTQKMIADIHAAGGRVIGRLVAFRDPKLTKWAWTTGRRDMVLQKTDSTPWTGSYGDYAFPNFAHPAVQQYNTDLAVEAAKLGFDDVLFDYVRRPDGKLSEMKIPVLRGTPEKAVAAFVAATKAGFQQAGVASYLGASVFGIAATRPTEIAQDVSMMAPFLDYVAPMVYPSHWGPGEYKVADPNRMPYEIVQRSLKDFQTKVKGSNTVVIPWLQDFSLGGVKYGPDQVRAQIKASADDGVQSFLLWNAEANYQGAALVPMK